MELYKKYFGIHFRSAMQYKVSFLLTTIGQFLVSFNIFLGIYFLFARFSSVKGYTYQEVMLCFAVNIMAYSVAEMFARGFDTFPSMINNGEFDRILVRPKGILLQILCSKIEFTRIGRMIQAIVMFTYGVKTSGVPWSVDKIITVCFMLIGGTALYSALFLLYAAVSFFTIEGIEVMNIVTDGAREYGKYPFDTYGKAVLKIVTYVVPFALFQYYPFLYLLGRNTNKVLIILPLASAFFYLPCYLFFQIGLKHYKSTGS